MWIHRRPTALIWTHYYNKRKIHFSSILSRSQSRSSISHYILFHLLIVLGSRTFAPIKLDNSSIEVARHSNERYQLAFLNGAEGL